MLYSNLRIFFDFFKHLWYFGIHISDIDNEFYNGSFHIWIMWVLATGCIQICGFFNETFCLYFVWCIVVSSVFQDTHKVICYCFICVCVHILCMFVYMCVHLSVCINVWVYVFCCPSTHVPCGMMWRHGSCRIALIHVLTRCHLWDVVNHD